LGADDGPRATNRPTREGDGMSQRTIIYLVGAIVVIVLIVIFATN
jgi:hypothetical protein